MWLWSKYFWSLVTYCDDDDDDDDDIDIDDSHPKQNIVDDTLL